MKVPMVGEKTADKAVGRTRGGLNTKIHAVVDALGNPVKFLEKPVPEQNLGGNAPFFE